MNLVSKGKDNEKVSLLIADPPWPNLSAIRSKSYNIIGGTSLRKSLLNIDIHKVMIVIHFDGLLLILIDVRLLPIIYPNFYR